MLWSEEMKALLLSCESDAELEMNFPEHRLESLKRRQREFRTGSGTGDESPSIREKIGKLVDLLDANDIPIDEIGRIEKVRLNEWEGFYKDGDGVAQKVNMSASSLILTPRWKEGPEWQTVQQAQPIVVQLPSGPAKRLDEDKNYKTAFVYPDMQVGFRRTINGKLVPFHDNSAIDVATKVMTVVNPDRVVWVGDGLDLPEQGKYAQEPAFAQTTQMSMDYLHRKLCEAKAASSPWAEWDWIEGNHEVRYKNSIMLNAAHSYGLQRANLPDSWPVLSVPYLTRMDELGITYHSGYPANVLWLVEDELACVHGSKVKSNGSTAAAYVKDERHSVVFGHVHRIETHSNTKHTSRGPKTNFGYSPGCLCRIDGAVPSVHGGTDLFNEPIRRAENWAQGALVLHYNDRGLLGYEQIYINRGTAMFRGVLYTSD